MQSEDQVIEVIKDFSKKLDELLNEYLPQLPFGVVIYNEASFKAIDGITEKDRKNCFIPTYHGLLNIGYFDHIKGILVPLSKCQ